MKFNIVTYNVFCPVPAPLRYTGQEERMKRIPMALKSIDKKYGIDVLIIQETIAHRNILLDGLRKHIGFEYFTQPIVHPAAAVSGGIIIASKTPFTDECSEVFLGDCTDADCLAAKGVVHIKTEKNGLPVHIFGTHLQALDRPDIRLQQITQLSSFVSKQDIPTDEPYFIGGDLNFDRYADLQEYNHWLMSTNTTMPAVKDDSEPWTWNPENNQLVGADGDVRYSECYAEYLEELNCKCCGKFWFDYITHGSLKPRTASLSALALKSEQPYLVQLGAKTSRYIQDLSDHYPVIAEFEFDAGKESKLWKPDELVNYNFPILAAVSFVLFSLMLLLLWLF